eukprot:TRINITY_DN18360_c0_g1_i1.p1 TRINITY_DN18360_c0_g1~~TRINITY_DN18360_c0_g1_i1.p1  ORF type:complete len:904 (+),score=155.60 TRINITY_DN18360_c0_g1_i1:184-2712(+)
MPLSYMPWPRDYFDNVPEVAKLHQFTGDTYVYECLQSTVSPNGMVNATLMDAFTFQTEVLLSTLGLDIYDGAVWGVAASILGNHDAVEQYYTNILLDARTLQLQDIKAHAECKGDMGTGQCTDPTQNGNCGICYGDNMESMDKQNALVFRLIADYWAVQGTVDVRCPDLNRLWTWNDYKPILGENSWALILGPLVTALQKYGSASAIPASSVEFQLAINSIPALQALKVSVTDPTKEGYGAVYYAPNNVFYYPGSPNLYAGQTVSIENQASLYAGLKALVHVLSYKPEYTQLRCEVDDMVTGLEKFMFSSWNGKYFRQGGTYNRTTQQWSWGQAGSPDFAVDCQTWVATVLGPRKIDQTLGPGTTGNLWTTLKDLAGYGLMTNGSCKGFGYTEISTPRYKNNGTYDASPSLDVHLKTPLSQFNKADFLDRVSYISGESVEYIILLAAIAGTPPTNTVATIVFLQQGNEPALTVATSFTNTVNQGGDAANYLNATMVVVDDVFSAEWTLGAINFARVIVNESGYNKAMLDLVVKDADFMRAAIERELLADTPTQNTYDTHNSLLYANIRSYIPFGWWANPIPSMASTGWAVSIDSSFNPLQLFGHYSAGYPPVTPPPNSCDNAPPSPTGPPLPAPTPFPLSHHEILQILYESTNGPNWYASDNWLNGLVYEPCGTPQPPGSEFPYADGWIGVTCDGNGHIVELTLDNNNLVGTLPDALGGLTMLQKLSLKQNSISGTLPAALSGLGSLQSLQLSNNKLDGPIPDSFATIAPLKYLWLTQNALTSLPDLSPLANLQVLNVNGNQLTSLPAKIPYGSYPNCDLSQNPFVCPIPMDAVSNCAAKCT